MAETTQLRALLGQTDLEDDTLDILLETAEQYILAYCRRADMPSALRYTKLSIAVILHNRMGDEGAQGKKEGDASISYYPSDADIPKSIRDALNTYRKVGIPSATT